MRLVGGTAALAAIALLSSTALAEPTLEEAEATAAASLASRRFAEAGRLYEELFARSGRPEHLLAAARAFATIRTPEARARVDTIAKRYREVPGSDPAAMDAVLSAADNPAAPPPQPRSAPAQPSAPLTAPSALAPPGETALPTSGYAMPPRALWRPPPMTERRWYGWQTLIGLAGTDILIVTSFFTRNVELYFAGLAARALAPPIVHFAHGHSLKGGASLLLNVGAPLLSGVVLGAAQGEDPLHDSDFFFAGFIVGVTVASPVAVLIDVATLSTEEVPVPSRPAASWHESLTLIPMFRDGYAGLAVGGQL